MINKESNTYTIIFVTILILIIAAALSTVNFLLVPKQKHNLEIEKKSNILTSINVFCPKDSVELLYKKYIIDSYVVDYSGNVFKNEDAFIIDIKEEMKKEKTERKMPVFIAKIDENNYKMIFALIGKGLWGEISGYLSLDNDNNTIYGILFNHKSETPGLGAEIADRPFQERFIGKKIFDDNFSNVEIKVLKGKKEDNNFAVDALSGATITSSGVNDMISDCMTKYKEFIKNKK